MWVLDIRGEHGKTSSSAIAVRNALIMEELCIVLENLRAVFCKDIKRCQVLADIIKEPYQLAKWIR